MADDIKAVNRFIAAGKSDDSNNSTQTDMDYIQYAFFIRAAHE
jgi:hypothetical protein